MVPAKGGSGNLPQGQTISVNGGNIKQGGGGGGGKGASGGCCK